MRQFIELGSSPSDESCIQVSDTADYTLPMKEEVNRYVELLAKIFPDANKNGCNFVSKSFPHDFGSYREACIMYNDEDQLTEQYAYYVEENLPSMWSDDKVRNTFVPSLEEEEEL